MISIIVLALYAIVVLIYVLISLFIVYHLVRFSADSELKYLMLVVFVLVATGLLIANAMLFFSIDWNTIISNFLF
ncbi:MAG: hypothetical protein WC608_03865 [Parcubacteria group bacterium]